MAQGFIRVSDFARSVQRLRAKRTELRKPHPDRLRRAIVDTLERVIYDRDDLRAAARRAARVSWRPQFHVVWGSGTPRVYDSVRFINGRYYPKRDIEVPAAWLLARLNDGAPIVGARLRQADPRPRILATPHWIDRIAAGVLSYHESFLTAPEHRAVIERSMVIRPIQWRRRIRKPQPAMQVGEIRVAPSRPGADGYVLTLSGVSVHHWSYWPTRAEIVAAVAQAGKQREQVRKQQEWRGAQERVLAPSPDAPDTLGWRGWRWDGSVLISPVQRTPWHDSALSAAVWSDSAAVRGEAGIHARRMPCDWRRADPSLTEIGRCNVHGVVERFGRYVLGTEGWRAEWVVIRELQAPDVKTALALMQRYPEVRVHIKEQEMSQ